MRGIIFTEFVDMVEAKFSLAISDRMLRGGNLPSGGAYTAVGTYDHMELRTLLTQLSRRTDRTPDELLQMFGCHLFGRLAQQYGALISPHTGCFDVLANVNSLVHGRVLMLYPDAELPVFEHSFPDERSMRLIYRSPRRLAALAHGLIQGCAAHFGEPIHIERLPHEGPDSACFLLTKQTAS